MTREPLDSRIEMMIASLYGELSPEDEARFRDLRSSDPELQKEWEELTSTRSILGAWEFDEPTPAFEHPLEPKSSAWDALPQGRNTTPARKSEGGGWLDRLRALLDPSRGLGWAVAGAALVLLALSWSGLRVERVDGGFAFRMNPAESPSVPNGSNPLLTSSPGGASPAPGTTIPLTGQFASVDAGTAPYLTRSEFDAYTAGMARVMSELVHTENENSVRNQEFSGFMRTLVESMSDRRDEDRREFITKIEALRYGLQEVEAQTNDRIDLIQVSGQSLTPPADREGGK